LIVDNFDVDNGSRLSGTPDPSDRGESLTDCWSQKVRAEIHGGYPTANQHADGKISCNIDEGGNWSSVELTGARSALEFRPHSHPDLDFLLPVVQRNDP
jgi:hypothetical protein